LAEARRPGDNAVWGLAKITAQMTGGEHRSEQQEMVPGRRADAQPDTANRFANAPTESACQ
jgi:hypothetical protein